MDLVYVTYNSQKWIKGCFDSILNSDYDLKKISIYVVDNGSTDDTLSELYKVKKECDAYLKSFSIVSASENLGFGKANNLGFAKGTDEVVCFFNIDTELFSDTLKELEKDIHNTYNEFVLWELRQFPYEHPKKYDALTQEVSWASGAAFAVKREVFEQVKGFDDAIFMYGEDVDLSWRIRSFGYKLKYVPKATIMHYTYKDAGETKPVQYVNSVVNNILLRYRYANMGMILKGHYQFMKIMLKPSKFPHAKRLLLKDYFGHLKKIAHFIKSSNCGPKKRQVGKFLGFDYENIREGGFVVNSFPEQTPLVSIIIRTCGRPEVLEEAMISLRNQTYQNIEIVVVEDGCDCAGTMLREKFSDLNIIYKAMGKKVGRSKAGNAAMTLANGKYLNFLDDDDLFYADHVECLVQTLLNSSNRAAYAYGFETPITVVSTRPYEYIEHEYKSVHKKRFNKSELCYHNYIPIQCIMFERTLFEEHGGLDETLDALEDWDLWVRYSQFTDFDCVEKTTSLYRVPFNKKIKKDRQKNLDDALVEVREKHKSYVQTISAYDLAMLYEHTK